MAWPPIPNVTPGLLAQGVTTLYWGTEELWEYATVLRFNQRELVDNIKLPQGVGLTATRMQIHDGVVWDISLRDDSRMTRPTAGTKVTVIDAGGLYPGGNRGAVYSGRVVESSTDVSPKNPMERTISVEKLRLITET